MARNKISRDPVSKHVPEREKLLVQERLALGFLWDKRRQELERSVVPSSAGAVGQIITSALLFGGLLDWQALERLCKVLSAGEAPPEHRWLDFKTAGTPDDPSVVRRWLVDARTLSLWEQALGLLKSLRPKDRPCDARAAIAAHLLCNRRQVEQLHGEACAWWRQRLPPVLAIHIEGEGPSRAVPHENWQRLLTDRKGPGGPQKPGKSQEKPSTSPPASVLSPLLKEDLRLLGKELRSATSSDIASSQRSAKANRLLGELELQTVTAQHVRDWFRECLTLGYDRSDRQGQAPGRIVKPSSLLSDLSWLRKGMLSGLMRVGTNTELLIELYASELPDDMRQDNLERKFTTIRRFHRWLVTEHEYPSLKFSMSSAGPQSSVWARLISENEYHRALKEVDANALNKDALRVALILGFRAGLRPQELRALQSGDFRIGADSMILIIKPNHHNRLKTSNARRLLPLHLLLSSQEQAEVAALARSRQRFRGKDVKGSMLLHGAIKPADVTEDAKTVEKQLEALLATATGDQEARLYDLRHSFASYLLATLLLPEGVDARLSSTVGPDCISKARRDRLIPHLLGKKLAGRPALYAVSFLMGHASPDWTLVYYTHLMDWSAAQYVSLRAFDDLPPAAARPKAQIAEPPQLGSDGEHGPKEYEGRDCWPEWPRVVQALSDLIDGGSLPLVAAKTGIDKALLGSWLTRLRTIVACKTRTGRQRHRFVASTRGLPPSPEDQWAAKRQRFLLPREDFGLAVIERVWASCRAGQGDILADPDVVWSLQMFLHHADPARCDVPFADAEEAIRYVSALSQLGLDPGSFRVRLQKAGTAHRSSLLHLPEPHDSTDTWRRMVANTRIDGEPIGHSSRYRISIVSDHAAGDRATPSHRIAIILAAAVGHFSLQNQREK